MSQCRIDVVRELVDYSDSLEAIAARLQKFDWDYEGTQVELSRLHLINVLNRYLKKELTANDVERWANLLEGREDVFFESGSEDQIDALLCQLANPTLTAPLSEDSVMALITDML